MRKAPNDPKLSDWPRWRGPCTAGGEGGGQEAGAVTARPVRRSAWLGDGGSSGEDTEGTTASSHASLGSSVGGAVLGKANPMPIGERAALEEPWDTRVRMRGLEGLPICNDEQINVSRGMWPPGVTEDGEHILSGKGKKVPIRLVTGATIGPAADKPYGRDAGELVGEPAEVALNSGRDLGWRLRAWVVIHSDFGRLEERGLSFVNGRGEEKSVGVDVWDAPASPAQMAAWFRALAAKCEIIEKETL